MIDDSVIIVHLCESPCLMIWRKSGTRKFDEFELEVDGWHKTSTRLLAAERISIAFDCSDLLDESTDSSRISAIEHGFAPGIKAGASIWWKSSDSSAVLKAELSRARRNCLRVTKRRKSWSNRTEVA
jgi:hypothetical protein